MKTVYRIDCEWDIDLADVVFTTKKKAMDAIKNIDWFEMGIEESLTTLLDDGMVSIQKVAVK